jgi:hypothetical protein
MNCGGTGAVPLSRRHISIAAGPGQFTGRIPDFCEGAACRQAARVFGLAFWQKASGVRGWPRKKRIRQLLRGPRLLYPQGNSRIDPPEKTTMDPNMLVVILLALAGALLMLIGLNA